MALTTLFDVLFAAAAVLAAVALAGAALRVLPRAVAAVVAALVSSAAVAAWVLFALRPSHPRELGVAAGGLTVAALAGVGSLLLRSALVRADATDAHLAAAQARLRALIDEEAADRAAELERTLARARADSVSLLVDEERRIADERRRAFAEREREVTASLTEALTATQAQVEQRLAGWAQDLDRAAETTRMHITDLAQRQKQLVDDVGQRLTADGDRLAAESENQRTALARIRAELDKAIEDLLESARAEVESHAAERRRALHELDERMRRRERELLERIEREEAESAQRIRAGFEDVQRRQIEQVERIVERATSTYSEGATQQFAELVKASREDAARRLSRELDRAVEVFAREAEAVLAERLAHVGDAGAQRLERRLAEAAKSLERQRDEWIAALDGRIADLEADLRRRLEELGADTEAERAVLEARLQELVRRVEATDALQRTS
ncbi:MAG TPA: hypothetical protein VMS63_01195 [Gaiellaceae bacterium]|nr:hypothetical protein [Gaiellaceae bacterium]